MRELLCVEDIHDETIFHVLNIDKEQQKHLGHISTAALLAVSRESVDIFSVVNSRGLLLDRGHEDGFRVRTCCDFEDAFGAVSVESEEAARVGAAEYVFSRDILWTDGTPSVKQMGEHVTVGNTESGVFIPLFTVVRVA